MKLPVLGILASVSAAVLVVGSAGWRISRTHPNSWSTWARGGRYQMANWGDTISLQWHRGLNAGEWPVGPSPYAPAFAGFIYEPGVGVYAPFWQILVVSSLLPAIVVLRSIRRLRARRPGHCTVCGYDLRATPDYCPECGAVAAEKVA